nr:MAG TPA: hypothetical protein [Caudoviricetes sp.]
MLDCLENKKAPSKRKAPIIKRFSWFKKSVG